MGEVTSLFISLILIVGFLVTSRALLANLGKPGNERGPNINWRSEISNESKISNQKGKGFT